MGSIRLVLLKFENLLKACQRSMASRLLYRVILLSEIDQMATQVGIISKGQMIFQDSILKLREQSTSKIKVNR